MCITLCIKLFNIDMSVEEALEVRNTERSDEELDEVEGILWNWSNETRKPMSETKRSVRYTLATEVSWFVPTDKLKEILYHITEVMDNMSEDVVMDILDQLQKDK